MRNGSVVHLKISKGRIDALVSGSELYEVRIDIAALPKQNWQALKAQSAGKIGTLVELLQGKLSKAVMELVTARDQGLFPKPKEIQMQCDCPDGAGMCKHIAAVMYGVGNRLDASPELLFVLRGVDHSELIEQAIPTGPIGGKGKVPTIAAEDLGAIFDIEIGDAPVAVEATKVRKESSRKKAVKPATPIREKKAPAVKKAAKPATAMKEKGVPSAKKAAKPAMAKKEKKPRSAPKKK